MKTSGVPHPCGSGAWSHGGLIPLSIQASLDKTNKHKIRQNLLDIDIKPSVVDLEAVVIFVKSIVVVVAAVVGAAADCVVAEGVMV